MKRTTLTLAALALLPALAESAEPMPLEEDFLEYLSQFESESDNWTWFADEEAPEDKEEKPVKQVEDVKK